MGAINDLEKRILQENKYPKHIIEEIFRQIKLEVRKSYDTKLRQLQEKSTNSTDLDEKMAIAGKIDELISWKNELLT